MYAAEAKKGSGDYQTPRPAAWQLTERADDSSPLLNSFTDEDGYCRMVPQRVVARNGSMPNVRPPPVPPHSKKQSVPVLMAHHQASNGTDL